jgi:hypothetical protein
VLVSFPLLWQNHWDNQFIKRKGWFWLTGLPPPKSVTGWRPSQPSAHGPFRDSQVLDYSRQIFEHFQ